MRIKVRGDWQRSVPDFVVFFVMRTFHVFNAMDIAIIGGGLRRALVAYYNCLPISIQYVCTSLKGNPFSWQGALHVAIQVMSTVRSRVARARKTSSHLVLCEELPYLNARPQRKSASRLFYLVNSYFYPI
jgi:hypothetical protein